MNNAIVPYSKQIPLNIERKRKNYLKYSATVSYWWADWLMQWNWHAQISGNTIYAVHGTKKLAMHRVVKGLGGSKIMVDHINHNGLDNTEGNLRLATNRLNQFNSLKQKNRSSKYKGVSWDKKKKKYAVRITINKRNEFLGLFSDEVSAAKSYDRKAKELYGEYVNLNIPECAAS